MLSALPAAPCPRRLIQLLSSGRRGARRPARQTDAKQGQLLRRVVLLECKLRQARPIAVDQPELDLAAGRTEEGEGAVVAWGCRDAVAQQAALEGDKPARLPFEGLGRGTTEEARRAAAGVARGEQCGGVR